MHVDNNNWATQMTWSDSTKNWKKSDQIDN